MSNNVNLGTNTLANNTTGANNTVVGANAGRENTTGSDSVFIGSQAGYKNKTADGNTGVGKNALYTNETSVRNTAVGEQALFSVSSGDDNTAVGYHAGYSITTGYNNTIVGSNAGFHPEQARNVFNTTIIGRGAHTQESNMVQLGNSSVSTMGLGDNKLCWRASVPTTGFWKRGDVVFNLSVAEDGFVGWVCITAGNFGSGGSPEQYPESDPKVEFQKFGELVGFVI